MISDVELETLRLTFSLETEILMMELKEMLEKTISIEKIVRNGIDTTPVDIDSYRPSPNVVYPPKKKMKIEGR
jgi:transcription antitermination factor NusA-like protein